MKVLFLIPAPLNISPGQRFRFEHYLPELNSNGIEYSIQSFWHLQIWKKLFTNGYFFAKIFGVINGLARRLFVLTTLYKYEYVYIYREAAPIGPPVFEWIISKIARKKIIYDFDDSIWMPTSSSANPKASFIKCSWKVGFICKYSTLVSVGNHFLAEYVKKYNQNVVVIPTVVDTKKVHVGLQNQSQTKITVGWTGTFTNFFHLHIIENVVNRLKEKYGINFLIIAEKDPQLKEMNYTFKKWNFDSEIVDLMQINIGVMPLCRSEFELGKCGFKAIQFMSLGIPVVVSPVGANCDVVKNDETGFWASSEEQWFSLLEKLILDRDLRIKIGKQSQEFIQKNFSVDATLPLFMNLFNKKC
jgi:glycosyltransferase involved in cell wall biosynthesis